MISLFLLALGFIIVVAGIARTGDEGTGEKGKWSNTMMFLLGSFVIAVGIVLMLKGGK